MLRLILARHGRTSWNVQGRVQGGGGLDEVGRAQVAALTQRLAAEPITAVYASPAWRARQTAQPSPMRSACPCTVAGCCATSTTDAMQARS